MLDYRYDAKGRLIGLTDWDGQTSSFGYDQAGRHSATERGNGLRSRYDHDAAGRLRRLLHTRGGSRILRGFDYSVNALGNRTQAKEITPRTSGTTLTTIAHDDPAVIYTGIWAANAGFAETSDWSASLGLLFFGTSITLRMGQGADHSLYDVYLNQTLWQSYDGYAATAGERTISITLEGAGPHLLEIRNRRDKHLSSSGYKLRFKNVDAQAAYDVQTIDYSYDKLARVIGADYTPGTALTYGYDLAGNLINLDGVSRTYNVANQMTHDGTNTLSYDANGNMTSDGVNSSTWDRANRLVTVGSTTYAYDGLGNRISQNALRYLLDVQPGLTVVLGDSNGNHYLHAPRGIHAQKDSSGNWEYMLQDGLGSVRGIVDVNNAVIESRTYDPIGNLISGSMTQSPIGFTGEFTEGDLIYLRARYYNPNLGIFPSLDPWEGTHNRPMSLNGYGWVEGNVVNKVDATGMQSEVLNNLLLCGTLVQPPTCPGAIDFLPQVKMFKDLDRDLYESHIAGYIDESYVGNYPIGFPVGDVAVGLLLTEGIRETIDALINLAEQAGNDDAARNLRHFLGNTGSPMNDYPVDKMLSELRDFRSDIKDVLSSTVYSYIYNNQNLKQALNIPGCSLWSQHTAWQWVGNGREIPEHRQIYNSMLQGNLSDSFLSGPTSGIARDEYDWHVAMNKFHYAIAESIVVNEATGEAEVCYRIDLVDYYAWYINNKTGMWDQIMAFLDLFGQAQNYEIDGHSLVMCERFNANNISVQGTHSFIDLEGP